MQLQAQLMDLSYPALADDLSFVKDMQRPNASHNFVTQKWGRLKPINVDPLEAVGLPSKGDKRSLVSIIAVAVDKKLRMKVGYWTIKLSKDISKNWSIVSVHCEAGLQTPKTRLSEAWLHCPWTEILLV